MTRSAEPPTYEVGSAELRKHLADVMADVERGATVIITRRGQPIARITPADPAASLDLSAIRQQMPDVGDDLQTWLRESREAP